MDDWQSRMRSTLENLLIIFGKMHTTTNQRIVLENPGDEWFVKILYDESKKYYTWGYGYAW